MAVYAEREMVELASERDVWKRKALVVEASMENWKRRAETMYVANLAANAQIEKLSAGAADLLQENARLRADVAKLQERIINLPLAAKAGPHG